MRKFFISAKFAIVEKNEKKNFIRIKIIESIIAKINDQFKKKKCKLSFIEISNLCRNETTICNQKIFYYCMNIFVYYNQFPKKKCTKCSAFYICIGLWNHMYAYVYAYVYTHICLPIYVSMSLCIWFSTRILSFNSYLI